MLSLLSISSLKIITLDFKCTHTCRSIRIYICFCNKICQCSKEMSIMTMSHYLISSCCFLQYLLLKKIFMYCYMCISLSFCFTFSQLFFNQMFLDCFFSSQCVTYKLKYGVMYSKQYTITNVFMILWLLLLTRESILYRI